MKKTTFKEAKDKFMAFAERHGEYIIVDEGMNDLGDWLKTYSFQDGAAWYECQRMILTLSSENEVEIESIQNEYWNTEDFSSYYFS